MHVDGGYGTLLSDGNMITCVDDQSLFFTLRSTYRNPSGFTVLYVVSAEKREHK